MYSASRSRSDRDRGSRGTVRVALFMTFLGRDGAEDPNGSRATRRSRCAAPPGVSALARSQMRLPGTGRAHELVARCRLLSMVDPLTSTTRLVPPSRLTPIHAEGCAVARVRPVCRPASRSGRAGPWRWRWGPGRGRWRQLARDEGRTDATMTCACVACSLRLGRSGGVARKCPAVRVEQLCCVRDIEQGSKYRAIWMVGDRWAASIPFARFAGSPEPDQGVPVARSRGGGNQATGVLDQ